MALPAVAADKDKSSSKYAPTQADIDWLVKTKEVVGKTSNLESSGKGFTLIYEYEYLDPNQKGINTANKNLSRQQQQIVHEYNRILKTKNPVQREQRLQQLMLRIQTLPMQDLSKLFKTKKGRKDFDLVAKDTVKVRLKKLPIRYDEKGKVQEYTTKEKQELKGKDPSLPGYTGDWENLSNGQTIKVYVAAKKKKPTKAKDKEADKDKGASAIDYSDFVQLLEAGVVRQVVVIGKETPAIQGQVNRLKLDDIPSLKKIKNKFTGNRFTTQAPDIKTIEETMKKYPDVASKFQKEADKGDKDKDKEADEDDDRPRVWMVLILDTPDADKGDGKKGKN
jgi:hypothetical protein